MRYLKIRIRNVDDIQAARRERRPTMVYPDGYHDLNFAESGYITERTTGELYVLGAVRDDEPALKRVLASPDVAELNRPEAAAFSEANENRLERVTDEGRLRRLHIYSMIGKKLSTEDMRALDPNDPMPGLNLGRILADKLP